MRAADAKRSEAPWPEPEESLDLSEESDLRRGMRTGIVEGIYASISDNLAGPFLSLYALALGATHTQIGLVSALPALIGTGLQLPAAWLGERLRRRKLLTIIGGLGSRGLWLPIALIPFLQLHPTGAVTLLIGILVLRSAFGAVSTPAWTSLIADVVPKGLRGSYFANRNVLLTLAAIAATLASGVILKLLPAPAGYQATMGLAALFGVAASYSFSRFPDLDAKGEGERSLEAEHRRDGPGSRGVRGAQTGEVAETGDRPGGSVSGVDGRSVGSVSRVNGQSGDSDSPGVGGRPKLIPSRRARLHTAWNSLRKERAFTAFAMTSLVWNFGVNLPQPLFAVHFVETLKGSAGFWGVVTGSTFITTILGQRYWGPLSDRFGGRNVMIASGIVAAIIPTLWLGAFRPEHGVVINLISGFGWAGYNLAAFNLLLEVTPDTRRAMYVAGYNGLIGLSQFAGPFLGGVLADLIGVKPVFALSTVLRLMGWLLLIRRVQTPSDSPFWWRDYVRSPQGGVRGVWLRARQVPRAIAGRRRARREEARLREKVLRRMDRAGRGSTDAGSTGEAM